MAFGKAISQYSVNVSSANIKNQIQNALQKYFAAYGGADSYGRSVDPSQIYSYPSDSALKLTGGRIQQEIKGQFGDFYRLSNPNPLFPSQQLNPYWLKKTAVTELTQERVNVEVARVINALVVAYLKGANLETLSQNVSGAAQTLVSRAKNNINKDDWFKGWGLTVK